MFRPNFKYISILLFKCSCLSISQVIAFITSFTLMDECSETISSLVKIVLYWVLNFRYFEESSY